MQEWRHKLIGQSLAPGRVQVKGLIQHVEHIVLGHLSDGLHLLSRQRPHALETHICDRVPVINLAWQEHNTLHVAPHKLKGNRHVFS